MAEEVKCPEDPNESVDHPLVLQINTLKSYIK